MWPLGWKDREPSGPTAFFVNYGVIKRADAYAAIESGIQQGGWGGEVWTRQGVRHPLGADFSGMQDIIPQTIDEQSALSYIAQVPHSLMKKSFLPVRPRRLSIKRRSGVIVVCDIWWC
jgi:hypothetical protein